MSVRVMGAVFELDVCPTWKLVLLGMADHARDDGTACYPSIDTLARKTSLSRRGVQKVMRRLEVERLIIACRVSKGGRASEYKITLGNREQGSLFAQPQPRTPVPATANASAYNREPGSPEPSGTVKEPSGNHQHTLGRVGPSAAEANPAGFAEFWQAYPRKQARLKAVRAFRRLRQEELGKILAAVERFKSGDGWLRDGGRYVPHAWRFLAERRWEDEIPAPSKGAKGGVSHADDRTRRNLEAAGFLP